MEMRNGSKNQMNWKQKELGSRKISWIKDSQRSLYCLLTVEIWQKNVQIKTANYNMEALWKTGSMRIRKVSKYLQLTA